jgi:hypothetical protein
MLSRKWVDIDSNPVVLDYIVRICRLCLNLKAKLDSLPAGVGRDSQTPAVGPETSCRHGSPYRVAASRS